MWKPRSWSRAREHPPTTPVGRSETALSAAPPPVHGAGLAALGVVLLAVGLGADPAGRLLAVPAGLALLALGLRDLLLRPVLTADADGLVLRVGLRRHPVGWAEVERLRVVRDRRTRLLEVDLGDCVVVLPGRRLGADPDDVLAELERLRP